jgi:RNA polymerase sigma-70 factor (ECF subfamily)
MPKDNFDLKRTDEELVKLALKDREYYQYLIQRYENKLLRYIMRLARMNNEDARDVLQEVFLKTYLNLNDFDPSLKFSSWIYRIAHNEAVSFLRKNSRRPSQVQLEMDKTLFNAVREDLELQEDVDRKFFLEKIQKIIDGFKNKDYRIVLMLRYFEGRDYQEISDILKRPMGTVATLISRARKQLKEELLKNNKLSSPATAGRR